MKKYRVNESEHFNLMSMYDHLKCLEIDVIESNDNDALDGIWMRIDEVEKLMDVAYCIGALVTWEQLKRIREIRDERNLIRYGIAKANGASESDAAYAFM